MNDFFTNIDGILYVRFKGFLAAGWSDDRIKKANYRNGQYWVMKDDPTDARRPLVRYDTLRPSVKDELNAHFKPSVPEFYLKAPIVALVEKDIKAETFFTTYEFGDGGRIPTEKIAAYTKAASWLNMLIKYGDDIKFIRKTLNIPSVVTFFDQVGQVIKSSNVNLPNKFRPLRNRMRQYQEESYKCLVHGQYGNVNRLKIADATSQAKLLEMIAHPNQYDDVLIMMLYNNWAQAEGYEPIGAATVGVWRRKKDLEITAGRNGNTSLNEKYLRQVKGLKPSAPLYLTECDDYNLNYYYQGVSATKGASTQQHERYVSYIVADSYNGLILGKSYRCAQSPTVEMVRMAWIDAMYYIRDLIGDGNWYMPWEVKADGWQKGTLHPWFGELADFVPAGHGNKHRGYIEQLFGSPHAKRAEKLAAHDQLNYNGNNITAAHRGVNIEVLADGKARRPHVGVQAVEQIERFFYMMRKMPDFTRNIPDAPSREAKWLEAWHKLPVEDRRPISDERFLMLFGLRHEPASGQIRLSNRGVEPQIDGVKYSYDLLDYNSVAHLIGTKLTVIYDPYDMSRVLLTDDKKVRLMAKDADPERQPRALRDAVPGSRAALNAVLAEKKALVDKVGGVRPMLPEGGARIADPEAALLGYSMPKEVANAIADYYDETGEGATPRITAKEDASKAAGDNADWLQDRMNYANQKTNMEDYLND